MTLDNFEEFVEPKILSRGKSYYKNGQVELTELVDEGLYEAEVAGSEMYVVEVRLDSKQIVSHSCTCPYDWGDICKHEVAVFYSIRDNYIQPVSSSGSAVYEAAEVPLVQQVSDALAYIPKPVLEKFVLDYSRKNRDFGHELILAFQHLDPDESKEKFVKQLRSLIKFKTNYYREQEFKNEKRTASQVSKLVEQGYEKLKSGQFSTAINIAEAVIETVYEKEQHAEDMSGALSSTIDDAIDLLYTIAEDKDLPKQEHIHLRDYSIDHFKNNTFADDEYYLDLLKLAIDLSQTDQQAQQILDIMHESNLIGEDRQTAEVFVYYMLERVYDQAAAEDYLQKHLAGNSNFRLMAIKKAFQENDFAKAVALAKAGQEKNPEKHIWKKWLLKAERLF